MTDCLIFKVSNLIDLLDFHIALPELLLTACADQLLSNLSLIKLCSASAKMQAVLVHY